jgi:hypothetical protein
MQFPKFLAFLRLCYGLLHLAVVAGGNSQDVVPYMLR